MILLITTLVLGLLSAAIPIRGTDVWFSQFTAVAFFGILFLAHRVFKISKMLGIILAYCDFSMVFISKINMLSFVEMLMVGVVASIFIYVTKLDTDKRNLIYKTLTILLLFQISYGFIQKLNLDPIFRLSSNQKICDTVGFSGSHNQYSLFMSILSPLLFENILGFMFIFMGIALSTSISGLMGMISGILFYYRKEKIFLFLIFGIVMSVFFFFLYTKKDYRVEFKERVGIWRLSISQVMHGKAIMDMAPNVKQIKTCNPLFGFGFGEFFQISPFTQTKVIMSNSHGAHRYEHAHNDYIEIIFDLGIIGSVMFILWVCELVMSLKKIAWDSETNLLISMLVCCGVCALSIYTIHTAYNGILIAVILGLLYAKIKEMIV